MDETKTKETVTVKDQTNEILLEQMEALKKNSVPRGDYDKIKDEYSRLVKLHLESTNTVEQENDNEKDDDFDIKAATNILLNSEDKVTNLEYWDTALKTRDYYLKTKGIDIFKPAENVGKLDITDYDAEIGENVAKIMKEAVDEAAGDPRTFNLFLDRDIIQKQ